MSQKKVVIAIPEGLEFSALKLARDAEGMVGFDRAVIAEICAASGIDPDMVLGDEDNTAGLIVAWYVEHRRHGGAPDATADDLFAEMLAENAVGGGMSYPPGRA